jgi:hypothetical protein
MAYYAWSRFPTKVNEAGQVMEWIEPGDTITKAQIKVPDEEWDELVRVGAVREEEYPEDLPDSVSPAEHYRQMEQSGEMSEEDLMELNERLGRGVIRDSGTVSGQIVNEDTIKAVTGETPKGTTKSEGTTKL